MNHRENWLRASALLGALFCVTLLIRTDLSGASRSGRRATLFSGGGEDTVVVLATRTCTRTDTLSEWTFCSETFAASPHAGRKFVLLVDNGAADGSARVSGLTVTINGREWVGRSEVTTAVGSFARTVELSANNSLEVAIRGALGTRVSYRVVSVPDCTFPVSGPIQYTRGSGPPQTVTSMFVLPVGAGAPFGLRVVNGTASGDQRVSSGTVRLNGALVVASGDLGQGIGVIERQVALQDTNRVEVRLTSASGSFLTLEFRATDTVPPVLVITTPAENALVADDSVTVSGIASDLTVVTVTVSGDIAPTDSLGQFSRRVPLPNQGANVIHVVATDCGGAAVDSTRTVIRDDQPPALVVTAPADGSTTTADATTVSGTASDAHAFTLTVNGDTVAVAGGGAFTHSVDLALGANTITVVARDVLGNTATATRGVTRSQGGPTLPPDPATVATELDATVVTPFHEATAFLYTGNGPIQTGVTPGAIDPLRTTVIRGRVLMFDGQPLPGARVAILDHPEFGSTTSRADGGFDLAANGGGLMTIVFEKAGFLTAQRQLTSRWRDYAFVDDVVLVGVDPGVTSVDFSDPIEVARGSQVVDTAGTRRATLMFEQGTAATMVLPGGATQPLGAISVRATEYTVGERGPDAMPAMLPPTSAYTYCVELSVDEASAAGATQVRFSKPVRFYVENFINLPIGLRVPVGTYDRERAQWLPGPDGRVVKLLSVTGGLADLDTNGDGLADGGPTLDSLGILAAERSQLASLYLPGQSLWRVRTDHFSPIDLNLAGGTPPGATAPGQPPATESGNPVPDPCEEEGSIIECQNQTLGQRMAVAGTSFTLNYRSSRTRGNVSARKLVIPLSGGSVHPTLKRIELEVFVAGQRIVQSFPPLPNQSVPFVWDGKDGYGRPVQGAQFVQIRIGYRYPLLYRVPPAFAQSFGMPCYTGGCELPPTVAPRAEATLWQEQVTSVGNQQFASAGLAGWSLSPHHAYDGGAGRVLYRGDGTRRDARWLPAVISTVARGQQGLTGFGDIVAAGDGSFYLAQSDESKVYRLDRDGTMTVVAGTNSIGYSGDGGPATQAQLNFPLSLALGPDGSLYIGDHESHRIRKVGPDGIINTVAGNGVFGGGGDGGPATQASIKYAFGIAVGTDGSLYLADVFDSRIRRVGPDGIISTIAGGIGPGFGGDGGPGRLAQLNGPQGVAVGPDGAVYVADTENNRVRRLGTDGIITTIAGNGGTDQSGDGGPGTLASVWFPTGLGFSSEGGVYVTEPGLIRYVAPTGTITTAGGKRVFGEPPPGEPPPGEDPTRGEGGPANGVPISARHVAVNPEGILYLAENDLVRKVAPALPGATVADVILPSEDGTELYEFSSSGRLRRTIDAFTGAVRYRFNYTAGGRLSSIVDIDGNVTTLERDAAGRPTAVVGPYGHRTTLSLDGNDHLSAVTGPGGETVSLTTTSEGLLTHFSDARGNPPRVYQYDTLGRLERAEDPAGGFRALTRSEDPNGHTVATESAEGRTRSYPVSRSAGNMLRREVRGSDGLVTVRVRDLNLGTSVTTFPDGTESTQSEARDPRFGMQTPVLGNRSVTTPGGLTANVSGSRIVSANPGQPLGLGTLEDRVTVNGHLYRSTFDRTTLRFSDVTPMGRTTTTTVDTAGRPLSVSVPGLAPLTSQNDSRGRLIRTEQAGRVWQYAYDDSGRLERITDPLLRVTEFQYDAEDRLVRQVMPDLREIRYGYDANGNLTGLTPPGRPQHGFDYTAVDLTEDYTPPDVALANEATHYAYDRDRQLTRIERPDGVNVELDYDGAGRLGSVTIPRGTIGFTYNAMSGNLASLTSPDGVTLSYLYDGSLPTRETWSGAVNGNVAVSYDGNFRPVSQTVNDANGVTFGYDLDGLLTSAGALTLGRQAANGLLLTTGLGSVTTNQSYDGSGDLSSFSASLGATNLFQTGYVRDALGRITQLTETVQGTTTVYAYGYDQAARLETVRTNGVLTHTYGYDASGNRLSFAGATPADTATGTYDAQDRLLRYGNATFAYSANGELRMKAEGTDTTHYNYDELGNLIAVVLPNGDRIDYLIDGQNRRVGQKLNGVLARQWLYQNGLNVVAELDGSGALLSRFVYGSRGNVADYLVRGGVTYRIITDHLGSVRLVVNASTGAVVQRLDYDVWGRVLGDTNPGFQPFGYAAGLWDTATGLVRFGARDYRAEHGRWTSKDPIGFAGLDPQLYSYSHNDPVSFSDPRGLISDEDINYRIPLSRVPIDPFELSLVDEILSATPPIPQEFVNFSAGLGDALLLYAPVLIRQMQGIENTVQPCTDQYRMGQQLGHLAQLLLLGKGFQPGGFLNRGQALRIGLGKHQGRQVFRIAGEWIRKHLGRDHIDLWRGGRL